MDNGHKLVVINDTDKCLIVKKKYDNLQNFTVVSVYINTIKTTFDFNFDF